MNGIIYDLAGDGDGDVVLSRQDVGSRRNPASCCHACLVGCLRGSKGYSGVQLSRCFDQLGELFQDLGPCECGF